jgi:hypothetical protein
MASYIQKHEASTGDKVVSPERDLWVAVLGRALLDAFREAPKLNLNLHMNKTHGMYYKYNRDQARHFFLEGGEYFKEVCEMAGRNPQYVKEKVRKLILRSNGWNVDVPISFTSKYRKQKKQKGLTGNSYYAARRKEKTSNQLLF